MDEKKEAGRPLSDDLDTGTIDFPTIKEALEHQKNLPPSDPLDTGDIPFDIPHNPINKDVVTSKA